MGAVLRGVVPPDLIVGSAVSGPQIDVLVTSIALEPKSDADEAACALACASSRLAGQIHFDGAVTKRDVLEDGIGRSIFGARRGRNLDRAPAFVVRLFERNMVPDKSIDALGEARDSNEH